MNQHAQSWRLCTWRSCWNPLPQDILIPLFCEAPWGPDEWRFLISPCTEAPTPQPLLAVLLGPHYIAHAIFGHLFPMCVPIREKFLENRDLGVFPFSPQHLESRQSLLSVQNPGCPPLLGGLSASHMLLFLLSSLIKSQAWKLLLIMVLFTL